MEDNPTNLEPMLQSRAVITDGTSVVPAVQAPAILVCTEQKNPVMMHAYTSGVPNHGIGEIPCSKHLYLDTAPSAGLYSCLCSRIPTQPQLVNHTNPAILQSYAVE